MDDINAEIAKFDDGLYRLACTDGNCAIRRPVGQVTNGGCRCVPRHTISHEEARVLRAALMFRQHESRALRAALELAIERMNFETRLRFAVRENAERMIENNNAAILAALRGGQ